MTFYKNIEAIGTTLSLIIRKIFLAGLIILVFGPLLADATTQGRLARTVTLTLGVHQVVLASGTAVTILHQEGENLTVSFNLADGSPVITQIPATSLTALPKPKVTLSGFVLDSAASTIPISTSRECISTEAASADNTSVISADPNSEQVRPASSPTLSPEDIALPSPRFTALNGSFYITIHGLPVLVVYSLPMEGERLAKSASNLVFYGPFPNEKTDLKGNIVPDIVTKLGCAVFSLSFTQSGDDLSNLNTGYWFKESGWFEAVMAARDEIIKGFALERKKLLLMGYSGGGGMVLNLAGAFPNQVDAVAAQGANLCPELKTKNSISWLIINNRGETNAEVTIPFYKQLKEMGCAALYCETTPERGRGRYHAPSQEAYDLIYTFLAGVLEQRKHLENGIEDLAHLWPYAADSDPLKRYAVIRTLTLDDPIVSGNHFDLLPSAAFAWNWCKVCPPVQTVSFYDGSNLARLHVNFPATDKPIGVILYYEKPDYRNVTRQVEDVSSLAEHGCVVISPIFGMSPERFAHVATQWVFSQDNLGSIPIHMVGYEEEGARFLACMNEQSNLPCRSLSLVSFYAFPLTNEVRDRIESLAKGCGLYSFFTCQKTDAATPENAFGQDIVTDESRSRGCQNLIVEDDVDSDEHKVTIEQEALDVIKQTIDTSRGNIVSQEPDVWLEDLTLPEKAAANNQIDIKVRIRDRGIYGQQGSVQLKSFGRVLSTCPLSFDFDGAQDVTLSYIPVESGHTPLEVVLLSVKQGAFATKSRLTGELVVK